MSLPHGETRGFTLVAIAPGPRLAGAWPPLAKVPDWGILLLFFALILYSFEPNILAHARLMNTDLAVAWFFFMTVYSYVGGTAAGYAYPLSWEQLLRGRSEVEAAIQWAREAKLLPEPHLHGLSIGFFSMVEVP